MVVWEEGRRKAPSYPIVRAAASRSPTKETNAAEVRQSGRLNRSIRW